MKNPLICAIDTKDVYEAVKTANILASSVAMVKLGLEFFTKNGTDGVNAVIDSGVPVFLDLKFHDIPNTVEHAVRSAVNMNIKMMTIHTLGGIDMMKAAVKAANDESDQLGKEPPLIVGVTVLTSIDDHDLHSMGVLKNTSSLVEDLAILAKDCGLDGVVCSPFEIDNIKSKVGPDFKTVVPGIRPRNFDKNDQKRIMTPSEAVDKGADYLVIGRPITQSNDLKKSADDIITSIY